MHLTPRDVDKLVLHGAGFLAQKRLARGIRLNYPESVALIATQLLEFIRDGQSVADLMDRGRRILGRAHVMPGVGDLVTEVQVEGTFPDGTKLVTVHGPIALSTVDLDLALYGTFLPVPRPEVFAPIADSAHAGTPIPGELFVVPRGVEHCPDATEETLVLLIEPDGTPNTGDTGGPMTAEPRVL